MLYTIVGIDDIFYDEKRNTDNKMRSTNPYDYIRCGCYLDLPSIYGGYNCVNINCNISSFVSGNMPNTADK